MTRPVATAMRLAIRGYQVSLSPAFAAVGVRCRHEPSCSAYARDALEQHGAWAGGWLAASRLCRCHPFGSSGWDPVPERLSARARWYAPWRFGDWSWRARSADPNTSDQEDL